MTPTLSDLLERVKSAGGPDRELDANIATAIGGYIYEKRGRDQKAWFYPTDGRHGRRQIHGSYDALERFTASVDAALALVERLCPDLVITFTRIGDGSGMLQITEAWLAESDIEVVDDMSPMEPMPGAFAILCALLTALQASPAAGVTSE